MKKEFLLGLLTVSLAGNVYFFVTRENDSLSPNAQCSQYNEQALQRIGTYYTNGESESSLDQIFYSPDKKTCIAAWKDYEMNENGMFINMAIFDAITNEDIFSPGIVQSGTDRAMTAEKRYDEIIDELK